MTAPQPPDDLAGLVELYLTAELVMLAQAAAGVASAVADVAADAVADRLVDLAARIVNPTSPGADRLRQIQRRSGRDIRAVVADVVDVLGDEGKVIARRALARAREDGAAEAIAELRAILGDAEPAAAGERDDDDRLVERLDIAHTAVLRTSVDAYRAAVAQAVAPRLEDGRTHLDAAQDALDRLADRGITGFTDRSGRRWELASYVEMAVRTATARAEVDSHMDVLAANGGDLVWVSDAPQECRLCRPWEGAILSITGVSTGSIEVENQITGDPMTVRVKAPLAVARAAGLLHPNCRHAINLYVPGASRPPAKTADPEGDQARQQLRYLERQVRHWKKREAVALTPEARGNARRKVRDYQRRIKTHVDTTTAKRQRHREQIGRPR